jgi:membrane protein
LTDRRRGRAASQPGQIPLLGWRDVASRVLQDLTRDNVSLMAAGLAMYALLSVFPAFAAAVSLYGLVANPAELVSRIGSLAHRLPPGVWKLFRAQLQDLAGSRHGTLTTAAVIGLVVALWSASSGMSSLMIATNVAYKEREKRSLLVQISMSLLMTLCAVVGFILMLLLTVAVPEVLDVIHVPHFLQIAGNIARWALLWGFAVLGLAAIYRFAPSRQGARWRWLTGGSMVAATLWLVGTLLFDFYVREFASYQKTYGPLGDVVVMLMWFYLSGLVVVLGAEINSESERQTRRDTTTGPPTAMGERGAVAADTLGQTSDKQQS